MWEIAIANPRRLAIHFDTERKVFHPGEQISGYVTVDSHKPIQIMGLQIEFEGNSYCHWTETHCSGKEVEYTETHSGEKQHFQYSTRLYGSWPTNTRGQKVMLPEGKSKYPFVFAIPENIPSSFEGCSGHIRYELTAQIDRSVGCEMKRPVIINEIIDTNHPRYMHQPGGTTLKNVTCCCCEAGPLEIEANVDRQCYCPGETILITSEVHNNTKIDLKDMTCKLVQIVSYHATSKSKDEKKVISRIKGEQIRKGQSENWNNQPLVIPDVPPTINNSKSVVNIKYRLLLEVEVPYWGSNAVVIIPIVFGTVPFLATQGQPPSQEFLQQPLIVDMAPAPSNLFGYPDMAPPSYASVVGEQPINIGRDNGTYVQGNLSYMPTFTQLYQGLFAEQTSAQLYPSPANQTAPGAYPPLGGSQPCVITQQPEMHPPPYQEHPSFNPNDTASVNINEG